MERQIPKNVRQIGYVSDSPKIYVEDYVDTFFLQLSVKSEKEKQPEGAFLIGEMQKQDNEEYIYIYGAIKIKELKKEGGEYLINDKIWKCGCEECSQYFEEGEIIGWFVTVHDLQLAPGSINVKLHKKLFPKKNTVLVMKDSSNQEDVFFVHKLGDLMEIGGHYTYYEKNPCMQNYMIASRKKNGAVQTENVEDTARELSAAAAVDINFVADGTPLAENSAQNFEQNGNEPKIGKIEDEIAPAAVAQAAGTAVIMPFA